MNQIRRSNLIPDTGGMVVAQIEGAFSNLVRLKGLVPVDSLNPIPGNLHRVYGVGVTALVDFRL